MSSWGTQSSMFPMDCKYPSECLAVFIGGGRLHGLLENREIGGIAALSYQRLLHGRNDGASLLSGMTAVVILALPANPEDFREEMRDFIRFEINDPEPSHSGNIYQLAAVREIHHLGECSGVHSGVMLVGDRPDAQAGIRSETIDKR